MQENKSHKKIFLKHVLPYIGALAVIGMLLPSQEISAFDDTSKKMAVYNIETNDPYASDTLKLKVIHHLADQDSSIDLSSIDIFNSKISVSGFNASRPGIQAVCIQVNLVQYNDSSSTFGYSDTENAVINVINSSAPSLKLKKSTITVNNGDAWNPSSYIAEISDDSGTLPVLKEIDNVDMNTDGQYYASYIAVDAEGNSTSAILNVNVKTPQEVLDAKAEAEEQAQAAAEAEREAQAEEQERQARAKAAATLSAIDMSKLGQYAGGISTALSMAGNVPYAWGGTSPSTGFDCSGLVQYSYGLTARTTSEQQALGQHRYDVENAPAGALYFYGSESSPYHVSISLGNGSAVQALNPAEGIQVVNNSVLMPSYYIVIGQ